MSKQPPPAPTASAVGPCPTVIHIVSSPGSGSYPAPSHHPHNATIQRFSAFVHLSIYRTAKNCTDLSCFLSFTFCRTALEINITINPSDQWFSDYLSCLLLSVCMTAVQAGTNRNTETNNNEYIQGKVVSVVDSLYRYRKMLFTCNN